MQIIDEQGRIFKKFNLLDLAVILFIILCLTLLYIRIMKPEIIEKKINDVYSNKEIMIKAFVMSPLDLKRLISEGDIQNEVKNCYAKVEKIEEYFQLILLGRLTKVYFITFRLNVLVNAKGEYFFARYPIKIGSGFRFSTPLYEITGEIEEIDGRRAFLISEDNKARAKKEAVVEVVSDDLWLAKHISIGDKEEKEGCYAEVIDKAYKEFDQRNVLAVNFRIKTFASSSQVLAFGRDIVLKPGGEFLFSADDYIFKGKIVKIEF